MTQVKLFSAYSEDELEPAMNVWLAEHDHIIIKDIQLSSSVASIDEDGFPLFTALVIYKENPA